jgi:DNA-binding PadR family transcriptional regulator
MYTITEEGKEVLAIWIDYPKKQASTLTDFIGAYKKLKKQDK